MANPEEMFQCQTVNCGCIYDPDRGDRRAKSPKGQRLRKFPRSGNARYAGRGKSVSVHLPERLGT